jgi:hypothetical protein
MSRGLVIAVPDEELEVVNDSMKFEHMISE